MKNLVARVATLAITAMPIISLANEAPSAVARPAIRLEATDPGSANQGWLTVDEPTCISGLGRPVGTLPLPVTVALFDEAGKEIIFSRIDPDLSANNQFERQDAPGYVFKPVKQMLLPGRYRLAMIGQVGEAINPSDANQLLGPALLACSDVKVGVAPVIAPVAAAGAGSAWLAGIPLLGGLGALLGGGSPGGAVAVRLRPPTPVVLNRSIPQPDNPPSDLPEPVPEPITVVGTLLGGAAAWRMRKALTAGDSAHAKHLPGHEESASTHKDLE